jgi:hypothetical protein
LAYRWTARPFTPTPEFSWKNWFKPDASGVRGRLEAVAATRGLTPVVGREEEQRLLLNRWERVLDGEGQSTFGWPLICAATLKAVYDVLLFLQFGSLTPVDERSVDVVFRE